MNPKLKAALYVMGCIIGAITVFCLMVLIAMNEWSYWVVAGVFTVAMIYGFYKAFYEIFKDDEQ